jgi:hypothetical protein
MQCRMWYSCVHCRKRQDCCWECVLKKLYVRGATCVRYKTQQCCILCGAAATAQAVLQLRSAPATATQWQAPGAIAPAIAPVLSFCVYRAVLQLAAAVSICKTNTVCLSSCLLGKVKAIPVPGKGKEAGVRMLSLIEMQGNPPAHS